MYMLSIKANFVKKLHAVGVRYSFYFLVQSSKQLLTTLINAPLIIDVHKLKLCFRSILETSKY